MISVVEQFIINETGGSLMINGLNNNSASLVLDAAIRINSDSCNPAVL